MQETIETIAVLGTALLTIGVCIVTVIYVTYHNT